MSFLDALAGYSQGNENYQDNMLRRQQMQQQNQMRQMQMQQAQQEQMRNQQMAQGFVGLMGQQQGPIPPRPGEASQPGPSTQQMQAPPRTQFIPKGMSPDDPSLQGPNGLDMSKIPSNRRAQMMQQMRNEPERGIGNGRRDFQQTSQQPQIPPYQSMNGQPPQQQSPQQIQIPEQPKLDLESAVQKLQRQGITDPQVIMAILDKNQARLDADARQRLMELRERDIYEVRKQTANAATTRADTGVKDEVRKEAIAPSIIAKNTATANKANAAPTVIDGNLSQDAMKMAAQQFLITGTMPPMGMGKAAAKQRSDVLNMAAQMAKEDGTTSGDIQGNKADIRADSASLSKLTQFSGMIGSFEQTAIKNADLALQLAKKGGSDTSSPTINKWLQAIRKGFGDPDVVAFHNALETFKLEYAKIMSGATGAAGITEGARAHANELIDTAMSPAQLQAAIATAKSEMSNRKTSLKDEINTQRQSIRSVGKKSSPNAPSAGAVENGYRFNGGDPADPKSWEKV